MNALITTVIICVTIIVLAIVYARSTGIQNNRKTTNDLRDNNSKSEDLNRQTGDIIGKLKDENNEAGRLNDSIGEDNKTAGDIIAEVRTQKLD